MSIIQFIGFCAFLAIGLSICTTWIVVAIDELKETVRFAKKDLLEELRRNPGAALLDEAIQNMKKKTMKKQLRADGIPAYVTCCPDCGGWVTLMTEAYARRHSLDYINAFPVIISRDRVLRGSIDQARELEMCPLDCTGRASGGGEP